jgi:hypothetical protein
MRKRSEDLKSMTDTTAVTGQREAAAAAPSTPASIGRLVDLARYPIHDLSAPRGRALVRRCRAKMRQDGSLLLEGFVREGVVDLMCAEVVGLPAHRRLEIVDVMRRDPWVDKTLYEEEEAEDRKMLADHPLYYQMPQDVHAVASDLVPRASLLRQVYDSPEVMAFIAAVNGQREVHQYADEFQALNVMYIKDGGSRAWHYDGSDYVVTLMLQPADEGGEFEYAPFIRGEAVGDERFDRVKKLFSGQWPTKRTRCKAGALAVFNGRRSLHRVRTVFGGKDRIMSVLSYAKTPGEEGTPEKNVTLYGERVARIYEDRGVALRRDASGEVVVSVNKLQSKL